MSQRAGKACKDPTCPRTQPCSDHPDEAWAGSNRRQLARSGGRSQRLRGRVLRRDDYTCQECGLQFIPDLLVADHIKPLAEGGADEMDNMQTLCRADHDVKIKAEAQRGKDRNR